MPNFPIVINYILDLPVHTFKEFLRHFLLHLWLFVQIQIHLYSIIANPKHGAHLRIKEPRKYDKVAYLGSLFQMISLCSGLSNHCPLGKCKGQICQLSDF